MTPPTRTDDGRTVPTVIARRAARWVWARLERPHPLRPTSGGGLTIVLASLVVSIASANALGSTVRIRWSVGTHYGPEHAPTIAVLATIPIVVGLALVVFRAGATVLERADGSDALRGYYELTTGTVLLWLFLVQVVLVVANL